MAIHVLNKILFHLHLTQQIKTDYGGIEETIGNVVGLSHNQDIYYPFTGEFSETHYRIEFKINHPNTSFIIKSKYYFDLFNENEYAQIQYKPKYILTYNFIPPNWNHKQLIDQHVLNYKFISAEKVIF